MRTWLAPCRSNPDASSQPEAHATSRFWKTKPADSVLRLTALPAPSMRGLAPPDDVQVPVPALPAQTVMRLFASERLLETVTPPDQAAPRARQITSPAAAALIAFSIERRLLDASKNCEHS